MSNSTTVRLSLPRPSIVQAPDALANEWLVTNGLGGYASGTVSHANTRRYHGLLVASLHPPVERVVMVSKADLAVRYRGREFQLGCNEFADGTIAPRGFELLTAFELEDGVPVWTYSLSDAVLEQRIWMAERRNTTYMSFELRVASEVMQVELTPLCTYRDYHAHTTGGWSLQVFAETHGCRVVAFAGAHPYRLILDGGDFVPGTDWYWNFRHRVEAQRGLDFIEDLFRPGILRANLEPGATVTLICTAEAEDPDSPSVARAKDTARRRLLLQAAPEAAPQWIRQLTLAADQFVVSRAAGATVIAGYPWFGDWGRDTMIALPGLTLATGRASDAAAILRTFAGHTSQGMLPNRFPDGGESPEYNTVDAALWFFHSVDAYLCATNDQSLLADLYPTLKQMIDWHRRGTRFGIGVDPADGLLRAGQPGIQLTWMDAKIGDWVVTPRIGKPVEINALWHFALSRMGRWARELADERAAADYEFEAMRVAAVFSETFWFEAGGYLYDVVDGPDGTVDARGRRVDATLRPNQIFAVSLGTELLDPQRARAVVDICARELLTPIGLRSLSPHDSRYAATYSGGPAERDAVYHQGPVWSWLLGPFALAWFQVYRNAGQALTLLEGIAAHLGEACLGTISELTDADAPHAPRGCFAQAWSVSETLRAWHRLNSSAG